MTRLTFLIPPLCPIFFSGVGRGEQSGVDLCVYISVEPPPYCGIDVALWDWDWRGREAKKMSFQSA